MLKPSQIDQNSVDAHYRLAQCYLKVGRPDNAYQELMKTLELQPENLQAGIDLANLLMAAKQFKKAQETAEGILARDANNVDAYMLVANATAALGDIDGAIREMQTVVQLTPDQSRVYLNLALLQLSARQTDAEGNFTKAVSLDPTSLPARLALAGFYRQQMRWAEAEQQFRELVRIEPKSPAPYEMLAELLALQGKRSDAEQLLTQAKQAMPDISDGYRLLGDFLPPRVISPMRLLSTPRYSKSIRKTNGSKTHIFSS